MRLEPAQVRAVCEVLRSWGHQIDESELKDLIAEFDVIVAAPDPAANQLGKFRSSDPDTSRQAAKLNYPRNGSQRHKALMAIAGAGERGLIASEIETLTAVPFRSLTPRLGELKAMQLVKSNGHTRVGPMGARQDVLVLTELGRMQVRRRAR